MYNQCYMTISTPTYTFRFAPHSSSTLLFSFMSFFLFDNWASLIRTTHVWMGVGPSTGLLETYRRSHPHRGMIFLPPAAISHQWLLTKEWSLKLITLFFLISCIWLTWFMHVPKAVWSQESNGPAIRRGQGFTALLSILLLLHSFRLLFWNVVQDTMG